MNKDFKIHCISVIKNEVDIIEHSLKKALDWADYIYVYDNGSNDGTWEKVLSLQNDRIIVWKQDDKPFKEALRGEVFNTFRDKADSGDWWCRLDADEFYINSPREFLRTVPLQNHVVWGIAIEYYLTQQDLHIIDFEQDIHNILPKIRAYKAENSETRFFRHRNRLKWLPDASWPTHVGVVNPDRILYKHYKYRSPEQIQKRLDTRREAIERNFPGWQHANDLDWHSKLSDATSMNYDTNNNDFTIAFDKLPKHLLPLPKRIIQKIAHNTGVWP
jgi:glycosyltransferase involved in cell wall biosynthesis